jgi:hypothetical protein
MTLGLRAAAFPHGDPNDVVRSILRDPAYHERALAAAPEPSLWERFLQWVLDVLRPLFARLGGVLGETSKFAPALAYALIAVALAGLVLLLALLVRSLVEAHYARRRARPNAEGEALEAERGYDEWQTLAMACAQRGEYARAIRALFGAALAGLHERALVPFDPARTPGEYRRLVRGARATAAPAFDALTERFVYASYAPGITGRSEYEAASLAFAKLDPELRRA